MFKMIFLTMTLILIMYYSKVPWLQEHPLKIEEIMIPAILALAADQLSINLTTNDLQTMNQIIIKMKNNIRKCICFVKFAEDIMRSNNLSLIWSIVKNIMDDRLINDYKTRYILDKEQVFLNVNGRISSKMMSHWRIIDQGLNLEGLCQNKYCLAYNNKVWIKKGYGKFNLNKEVYTSKCPICSKNVTDVNNMSLYLGKMKVQGQIKGEDKIKEINSVHDTLGDFLTFENKV